MTSSTYEQTHFDADAERVHTKTNSPPRNLVMLHAIASVLFIRGEETKKEIRQWQQVLGRIAAIVSKTYAERGDDYKIADDEALMMIRDVLLEYNPYIISQTKAYSAIRLRKAIKHLRRAFKRRYPNLPQ